MSRMSRSPEAKKKKAGGKCGNTHQNTKTLCNSTCKKKTFPWRSRETTKSIPAGPSPAEASSGAPIHRAVVGFVCPCTQCGLSNSSQHARAFAHIPDVQGMRTKCILTWQLPNEIICSLSMLCNHSFEPFFNHFQQPFMDTAMEMKTPVTIFQFSNKWLHQLFT